MVKHVVMWTFQEGVDKNATFAELKADFDTWTGSVPGMLSFSVNQGFAGWDVCLISTHQDKAALETYQAFPPHEEIKITIAKTREQRASCDFLTD